ncbi:MAG: gliding motility-associated C-terminal domain-containing protein, partial [Putridiphycobacter sp.]|nr:gliding motility-associated C-terminal domain-containing protein [Putridiphycobacter sp.]
ANILLSVCVLDTTANLLLAGNYFITLTDDNGCTASTAYTLSDPPLLSATFIIKDVLCFGENTGSILASNIIYGTAPYTFNWTTPGLPNVPTNANKADNLPAGTYNLEIIDTNGCFNSWDFTINESDSIYYTELNARPAYCRTAGFQTGNGVLSVSAAGGGGNFTYEWTETLTGLTMNTSTWAGRNPGIYNIVATDGYGCTKEEDILLDSLNPEAIFTVESEDFEGPGMYEGTEPVKVKFRNESINFADDNNPNADTIFQWNLYRNELPDGAVKNWFFTYSLQDKPDSTYFGEEVYQVCLVTKNFNDCADTSCKEIIVHAVPDLVTPNVFTPGQSPNADFYFPNIGIANFTAQVFNRYGVVVFEFTSIDDKWNGTHFKNGENCSDGSYFYVYTATATNGTPIEGKGTVTLIRSKK